VNNFGPVGLSIYTLGPVMAIYRDRLLSEIHSQVMNIVQRKTTTRFAYDGDGTRVQQVGATTPVTTVFLGAVEVTISPSTRTPWAAPPWPPP